MPRLQTANAVPESRQNQSFVFHGGSALLNKSNVIARQAEALDENRIVLYKRGKQLGNGYYIVEISSNNTHLFIAAYDVESPESLLIELPEAKAQAIMSEFKNDYEYMASSLQVMNKRLVLLNPKYLAAKRAATSQMTQYGQSFSQMGQRPRTHDAAAKKQFQSGSMSG